MPGGNRTGPMGMGAMTGRAAGYCVGAGQPGYANPFPGRGFGMGFGRGARGGGFGSGGRGWRNMFHAVGRPGWMGFGAYAASYRTPDPDMEKQALKDQAEALRSELDFVQKRLNELEIGK
jgi:hypothetical protein